MTPVLDESKSRYFSSLGMSGRVVLRKDEIRRVRSFTVNVITLANGTEMYVRETVAEVNDMIVKSRF